MGKVGIVRASAICNSESVLLSERLAFNDDDGEEEQRTAWDIFSHCYDYDFLREVTQKADATMDEKTNYV